MNQKVKTKPKTTLPVKPTGPTCGTCVFYDAIVVGDGTKTTRHGWCAAKSKYPAVEMPGQVFPDNVARVEPGELAVPVIVGVKEIVVGCTFRREKKK